MIKRFFSLILCTVLLAGCASGGLQLMPPSAPETPEPAPAVTAQPVTLTVALPPELEALQILFDTYGEAQNVEICYTPELSGCDLAALTQEPYEGWAALGQTPLFAALYSVLELSPDSHALPLGQCGYGYLMNTALAVELLGEKGPNALENATGAEWEAFCETLSRWLEAPTPETVTLNGQTFALPEEKQGAAAALSAVFARSDEDADSFGRNPLSYVLKGQALEETGADAIAAPAAALYRRFLLEEESLYRTEPGSVPSREAAEEAFLNGCALFYRADTVRGSVLAEAGMNLRLLSLKLTEDAADPPVAGPYGWLILNPDGPNTAQGESFLLWLYTVRAGLARMSDLGLVHAGLDTPAGEPGRGLAARLDAGEFSPALGAALTEPQQEEAAALARQALADRDETAYVQGLCALLTAQSPAS